MPVRISMKLKDFLPQKDGNSKVSTTSRLTPNKLSWGFGFALPGHSERGTETASVVTWLIQLRWIALVAQIVAGFVGFRFIFLEPLLVYPYIGTVVFLCLFNVYSAAKLKSKKDLDEAFLFTQVAVDTVVLSFLLTLSGGTRNPFVSLLFIHATLGALLLKGVKRGWFLVLLLASLISLFATRDWQVLSSDIYVWEIIPLFTLILSIVVTWALVTSLSNTLGKTRNTLALAKSREARIHHLLALGACTAEFAHQFATPLNTLRMRIARLRRQDTGGKNADLNAIADTLEQSERILREMTAAPLDSSMLALEEVDLGRFLEDTVNEWKRVHSERPIVYTNRLKDIQVSRIPRKIFAKSVSNLLDNANGFERGTDAIEVELEESSNQLFIAVMDRGPGWPRELKNHGIRPHFTTRPGGTGLGLFNCQSLCEVMGGSLDLIDRSGGGAIAKLALPKTARS